ncbi:autotransporter family protein [Achromobacter marplatensis]|uniref:autotransporter family protein n=1 Tax=Achromobacter marplatensis TaxID=470868 RepID=UPI0039F699A6
MCKPNPGSRSAAIIGSALLWSCQTGITYAQLSAPIPPTPSDNDLTAPQLGGLTGTVPAAQAISGQLYSTTGVSNPALRSDGVGAGNVSNGIVVTGGGGVTAQNLNGTSLGVVNAMMGGFVNLGSGSTVNASGTGSNPGIIGATGLYARDIGSNGERSNITANNLTISASSDKAYGAYASYGAQITLTGLTSITTQSNGTEGWAITTNYAGLLSAENVVVNMDGWNGGFGSSQMAVSSWRGSVTTITGDANLTVKGKSATLLYASAADSQTNVNNVTGSAVSTETYAVIAGATGGGSISATGNVNATVNAVTTGYGLNASDGGNVSFTGSSTLNINGGQAATGLAVFDGGTMQWYNGTANINGVKSPTDVVAALYSEGTAATTASSFDIRNSTFNSNGDGIVIRGGTATVAFNNTKMTNASGIALDVGAEGAIPGTLEFTADGGSQLTGYALLGAGSTSNLTLQGNSLWNITGDSTLSNLVLNNSQAIFTPPTANTYKTLTVNNLNGSGGTISLNTELGDDNSPTDKIRIDGGTASGQTRLNILNQGGAGAVTVANGIRVVETVNGGTTGGSSFTLAQRVVAGPYEYKLFRGAATDANPEDWYLRSQKEAPPPEPIPGPTPEPDPEPLYRPEVGAYLANQRLAAQMFVHSLHDRLGEPQFIESQFGAPDRTRRGAGWMRVVGQWEGTKSRDGNFDVDTDLFLLQAGADVAQWKLGGENGRLHLGLMGGYGNAHSDVSASGNPAKAKGKVDGYSAGAYATWFQNDAQKLGAYVDTWFQYGWFNNEVKGDDLANQKYDAHSWAISAETGYAFSLGEQWVIEPQAQLIYVDYKQDDVTEVNGTDVGKANSSGVITRLGARTYKTFEMSNGRKIQPYATVNWWHSNPASSVSFNGLPVKDLYPANRYELKIGVNADLNKGWTTWANLGGSWGAQDFHQYAGRVGVKYTW